MPIGVVVTMLQGAVRKKEPRETGRVDSGEAGFVCEKVCPTTKLKAKVGVGAKVRRPRGLFSQLSRRMRRRGKGKGDCLLESPRRRVECAGGGRVRDGVRFNGGGGLQ